MNENEPKILIDFTTQEEHKAIERHLLTPGIYSGKMVGFRKIMKKKWKSQEKEPTILIDVLIQGKKIPFFMAPSITAYGPSTLYKVLEVTECLDSTKKAYQEGSLKTIEDIINLLETQLSEYQTNFIVKTVDGETKYSVVKEVVVVVQ